MKKNSAPAPPITANWNGCSRMAVLLRVTPSMATMLPPARSSASPPRFRYKAALFQRVNVKLALSGMPM